MRDRCDGSRGSTDNGLNSRNQFLDAEWFDNVVVRTHVEHVHAIHFGFPCARDDDRHVGKNTDLATHFCPINVGQAEIEDNGGDPSAPDLLYCFFSRDHVGNGIPVVT